MASSPLANFRVGIIGGGLGGLTVAAAFTQLGLVSGIQVDIYEAAEQLAQVGAGISLWPRAWQILSAMGIDKDLEMHLSPGQNIPKQNSEPRARILKGDEKEITLIHNLTGIGGATSFHRADVQSVLLKHVSPRIHCHLSHRLVSYQEEGSVIRLNFVGGRTAICDLLIGADGIKSVVRDTFLKTHTTFAKESVYPRWSGTFAYRSLIDSEMVRKLFPDHPALSLLTVYCGKNKHLVIYPILKGKLLNVVALVSYPNQENTELEGLAVTEATAAEISAHFTGWTEQVRCIVENMEESSRWAVQTVGPLEKHAHGRVILLGDSAHAMTPHMGSGAGQAIEDAYILARILAKSAESGHLDIQRISEVYDTVRRPVAKHVQSISRTQGMLYDLNAPGLEDVEEGSKVAEDKLKAIANLIETDWKWIWSTTPTTDLENAMSLLSTNVKAIN